MKTNDTIHECLLDYLGEKLDLEFLSDLHRLSRPQTRRLVELIEEISPDETSLRDWNDTLHYLTGREQPLPSPGEARSELIRQLSHRL